MTFEFKVTIEVKNDALTKEAGHEVLAIYLRDKLCDNFLYELPWVISTEIEEVK